MTSPSPKHQRVYPYDGQNTLDVLIRESPIEWLRSSYVQFLQLLFGALPDSSSYKWTPDPETSRIHIQDEGAVHAEVLHKRPAITLTRTPMALQSTFIGDFVTHDFQTGQEVKEVVLTGSIFINVVSKNDLEVERLAWWVAEHLWALQGVMKSNGGIFDTGRNNRISAVSPAGSIVAGDDGTEMLLVSVDTSVQYMRRTAITPTDAPILRSLKLSMQQRPYATRAAEPMTFEQGDSAQRPAHFGNAMNGYGQSAPAGGAPAEPLPKLRHPITGQSISIVYKTPGSKG